MKWNIKTFGQRYTWYDENYYVEIHQTKVQKLKTYR